MIDGGWIPAWRKLYDPDHWLAPTHDDPASRRDAWLDLCQLATHQPRRVGGTKIELRRGELITSVRTLADRWKWSKSRVHRFLTELECEEMIETGAGTVSGTVYRVVKYDVYAVPWDTERDSSGTAVGQEQQQKQIQPPCSPPTSQLNRRHRLPPDWQPHEGHARKCREIGADLADEAEGFRDYHEAKGTVMLSWDKAFFTWLRNAKRFSQGRRPAAPDRPAVPFGNGAARIVR